MFKYLSIVSLLVAFSGAAQAEFYLSKTVTTEGYVAEYVILSGAVGDAPFDIHYSVAASSEDARSAINNQSINGSVYVQHCDRSDFVAAGYARPQVESVQKNLKKLREAEKNNKKVRISYWDNGHPLAGKCIISLKTL